MFDIGIWPKGTNLIILNRNLDPKEVIRTNALTFIWLKVKKLHFMLEIPENRMIVVVILLNPNLKQN